MTLKGRCYDYRPIESDYTLFVNYSNDKNCTEYRQCKDHFFFERVWIWLGKPCSPQYKQKVNYNKYLNVTWSAQNIMKEKHREYPTQEPMYVWSNATTAPLQIISNQRRPRRIDLLSVFFYIRNMIVQTRWNFGFVSWRFQLLKDLPTDRENQINFGSETEQGAGLHAPMTPTTICKELL